MYGVGVTRENRLAKVGRSGRSRSVYEWLTKYAGNKEYWQGCVSGAKSASYDMVHRYFYICFNIIYTAVSFETLLISICLLLRYWYPKLSAWALLDTVSHSRFALSSFSFSSLLFLPYSYHSFFNLYPKAAKRWSVMCLNSVVDGSVNYM